MVGAVVQFWGSDSEKREGLFVVLSVMSVCKDETRRKLIVQKSPTIQTPDNRTLVGSHQSRFSSSGRYPPGSYLRVRISFPVQSLWDGIFSEYSGFRLLNHSMIAPHPLIRLSLTSDDHSK